MKSSNHLLNPGRKSDHRLAASYDSASGADPDFENHWVFANGASADAAANPEARKTIRERARYEILENNCYARGIVATLIDDIIGSGPRLSLSKLSVNQAVAIQEEWQQFVCDREITDKLRTFMQAYFVDGEGLGIITNNPVSGTGAQMDWQVMDVDRLTNPTLRGDSPNYVDGIALDNYGNPVRYDLLDDHPGSDTYMGGGALAFTSYSADFVIHSFRCDRPEQHRGVSHFAPALPLFALFRRFTLATVTAAENVANHAMVLAMGEGAYMDHENVDHFGPWEKIDLARNTATVIPNGRLEQIKPEHPASTFDMFRRQIINEAARCVSMPYNIAAADSAGYNYASGRLDHQVYDRMVRNVQDWIGTDVVDRLFAHWLMERWMMGTLSSQIATGVREAYRQGGLRRLSTIIRHEWQWDRRAHVDPSKEANGQATRLASGTTSRRREMLDTGMDIDVVDQQSADDYGITLEQYRQGLAASTLGINISTNETGLLPLDEETPSDGAGTGEDEADNGQDDTSGEP